MTSPTRITPKSWWNLCSSLFLPLYVIIFIIISISVVVLFPKGNDYVAPVGFALYVLLWFSLPFQKKIIQKCCGRFCSDTNDAEELDDLSNGLSTEEQFLVDTRGLDAWLFLEKDSILQSNLTDSSTHSNHSEHAIVEINNENSISINANPDPILPGSVQPQSNETCSISERTDISFYPNSPNISEDKPLANLSVFTNLPMLKTKEFNYFEVKLVQLPPITQMFVGFSSKPFSRTKPPGQTKDRPLSIGYGIRDGKKYYGGKASTYGTSLSQGDVLGVGVAHDAGIVFFTKNGVRFDDAFIGLPRYAYFPCICTNGPAQVSVNIGQATYLWIEANFREMSFAGTREVFEAPPAYHQAILPSQPPPVLATPMNSVMVINDSANIEDSELDDDTTALSNLTPYSSRHLSIQISSPALMSHVSTLPSQDNNQRWSSVLSYADVMHPPPAYRPNENDSTNSS